MLGLLDNPVFMAEYEKENVASEKQFQEDLAKIRSGNKDGLKASSTDSANTAPRSMFGSKEANHDSANTVRSESLCR